MPSYLNFDMEDYTMATLLMLLQEDADDKMEDKEIEKGALLAACVVFGVEES